MQNLITAIAIAAGAYAGPSVVHADYATYHFDNLRTGWNNAESILNQTNVASSLFKQRFSTAMDGNVYAQPLFASGVAIPGKGTHDVVYAATENDSTFALDAAGGGVLWSAHYANAAQGFAPFASSDVNCTHIAPTIGITGTPVLDRPSATLYFVAAAKRTQGGTTTYHQFLHAVDMTTGADRANSPVDIQASVRSPGGAQVLFVPQWELNRPALLLGHGVLYVAFGSHCDLYHFASHGWVLAYDPTTLAQLAAFNTSPDPAEGLASIWAGGFGLAADAAGAVYLSTANGEFDANTGGRMFGDTVLKLSNALGVLDYFTPHDQATLNLDDLDLGGGGPMLLPPQAGAFPRLLVEAGKAGTVYLVNRDRLGRYTPGGPDKVIQELPGVAGSPPGVMGGPAYFTTATGQPVVLYGGSHDHLKAFDLETSPSTALVFSSQSAMTFGGEGGTIPVVSSKGLAPDTAVVWAIDRPSAANETVRLVAFSADDLSHRLFMANVGPWFNHGGGLFGVPTVIAGRVYVGTGNSLVGFGIR